MLVNREPVQLIIKINISNFFFKELSQGPLSQGPPLTQGAMSQNMPPLSQPLSQPELSQVCYISLCVH